MTTIFNSCSRLFLVAALIAMLAQGAFAHTYLSSVFLNDKALDAGDCVRPHPTTAHDSPIPLLSSPDMTCGWAPFANRPANRKCPIAAGSTIGLQWYHQSPSPADDIVDRTHIGPIIVYLAKSETGEGNVWFKIYEDGYDAVTKKWAVDKLVENRGRVDIKLPSDIAPGNYLLRGEILALHNGYMVDGVQPYVHCVELVISGNGNANPSGVKFPGAYDNKHPGMNFDVYREYSSYPIPGPALYKSGSTPKPDAAPTVRPSDPIVTPAPTATPTSTPAATPAPTNPPSNAGGITVSLNGGTSKWWIGVAVSGASETTVKVEMKDSDTVSDWTSLADQSYAYVFSNNVILKTPISLRLTSSTGKVVVLENAITAFNAAPFQSGKNYGSPSSTSAPTATPTPAVTPKPTDAATPAPTVTPAPAAGSVKVNVHENANAWWFAMTVSGNAGEVSKVEVMDSNNVKSFVALTNNGWGWSYTAQGTPLVAPLTVRITSGSKQVTASVASITPKAVASAAGSL